MKAITKYKGSIKLSAIGDALGWITEFEKNSQSVLSKYGAESIEQFYDWKKNVGGRFYGYSDNIKAGSYSDDTQLLLAVARSIKKGGIVDNNYFAKAELSNWLHYARGGGRTVKTAADKISRKSVKWNTNFYHFKVNNDIYDYKESGANGAAMRVLPIALANCGDIEKIKEEIFCNSIITHGHPRAIIGAMLYGYAINQIIQFRAEDFHWEQYLTQIGLDFPNKFQIHFFEKPEIKEWLNEWNRSSERKFIDIYNEVIVETQNQLRFIYQSIKHHTPDVDTLQKIGCFAPSTKGSGISTVIAGIYFASKYYDNPKSAIIQAVNSLGSDTDSIAAFAGGLLGALCGQSIIPEKWLSIQDVEYLDIISERLLEISEDSFNEMPNQANHPSFNLLNKIEVDNYKINDSVEFFPLGNGSIISIDRQSTLTKGKYNLILEVLLKSGQSICVSKLLDDVTAEKKDNLNNQLDLLLSIAKEKFKPNAFNKFNDFVTSQKKLSPHQIDCLLEFIKNES